jgi:AI-2 transport protein TqsA
MQTIAITDTHMNDRFRLTVYATVLAISIGWILYIGKSVFVPIVFSVLVVYVILGLTRLLFKLPFLARFLPLQIGYMLAALVIALALAGIASLLADNLGKVAALAPQYSASLLNSIQSVADRMGIETAPTWTTLRQEVLAQVNTQRLIGTTVVSVSSIVSSLIIVLLYVAFLLVEQRALSAKLAKISGDPRHIAQIQKIVTHVNARIGTYLALKTLVSAVQGLVAWAILAFFGVEFALFWAVLIGLLNYVPYIGSILGVGLPVAFATMQYADSGIVMAILLSLSAAQFVIGFFLDPYLLGNSLNLSPFTILVSLAAWSAIWGIPGAFLAVPITACMVLVFAEFDGTRPIAVLLSRNGDV